MRIREPTDDAAAPAALAPRGEAPGGGPTGIQAPRERLAAPVSRPDALVRLFCLPHAGGGTAAYVALARLLPGTIDVRLVRLPGRETRLQERPHRRVAPCVADAVAAIEPLLDRPFALFGHSLGAVLAFELARRLEEERCPQPVHLFVSGRRAPHLPDPEPPLSQLPDEGFVAELRRRYDGIPQTVADTPELLELFLPILRADCEVLDTYAYVERGPLPVPISAFAGAADRRVATAELEGWGRHTSRVFRARVMPGAHFYFQGTEEALAAELERDLAPFLAVRGGSA
jgi:medium-chain acyl-[acyl-carrier-protein] hydrolase